MPTTPLQKIKGQPILLKPASCPCATCQAFLESLDAATLRLSDAVSTLRELASAGRAEQFRAALLLCEKLHRECQALRGKAEYHKTQHGPEE